jgi:hypothetical protein
MDMWSQHAGGLYIHRLHVTNEYTLIFLGTEEYNDIYSSVLYSLVASSVNQEI